MAVDLQPELRGDLLHLRPLRGDDFDALFAVAADPLIWEQHPVSDRYRVDVFRRFFDEAIASGGALVAFDARNGEVIGSSQYSGFDAAKSEIEVGKTFLARSHWGGVVNAGLKRLMLDHAFGFVDRVVLRIGAQNFRSQRAAQKIGARRVGMEPRPDGGENGIFEVTAATLRA